MRSIVVPKLYKRIGVFLQLGIAEHFDHTAGVSCTTRMPWKKEQQKRALCLKRLVL